MTDPVRIGVLTTLWRRPELSSIVLRHYTDLRLGDGIELVRIAVGSEGTDSLLTAINAGWGYISADNRPLGRKHNEGMAVMRDLGVAGVVVIGSDDLLTASYFTDLAGRIRKVDVDDHHLRGCWFYDVAADALTYAAGWHPGAGRYFSARLLERVRWRPWPEDKNRHLDGSVDYMRDHARTRSWIGDTEAADITLVDIKAGVNMWSYAEALARGGRHRTIADVREWWNSRFPGVREQLSELTNQHQHNG